jgi:hypothetical protein
MKYYSNQVLRKYSIPTANAEKKNDNYKHFELFF